MNQQEFKDQVRVRGEELKELEGLVQNYGKQIKNVQPLLRGSMIMSFRAGLAACLDHLDNKAKQIKYERELHKAVSNDFLKGSGGINE